ncbi:MAG: hypothetical protein HY252_18060 [Sphingobacteriales bacterium]|nr:hypothetical protein [Sphingobacteriales bacterium]
MTQDLLLLNDSNFWNSINERHNQNGGVYKIIAVRNETRIPINRFLGADIEGVLYIGKATSFIDRVIELKKSIAPEYNGTGHICGRRYKANPNIAKQFPYEILFIELLQTDKPEELERSLLTTYAEKFGEVPPLNAI